MKGQDCAVIGAMILVGADFKASTLFIGQRVLSPVLAAENPDSQAAAKIFSKKLENKPDSA
ncbi:MAG: hypothetical protein ACI9KN_000106 [Gammaproteobacteria bacterium]|jgi:hypothetical protein